MNDDRERLIDTIRQVYGAVAWSHKTAEKDCEDYTGQEITAKWINVILITATTVVLVISIFVEQNTAIWISTILATCSTAFAVYRLSFSPEKDANLHREVAKSLLTERDKLLFLLEKAHSSSADLELIREELYRIRNSVGNIYSLAPNTSSKAYERATKALKQEEELTFSDEEIDNLVPEALRKTQSNK